DMASRTVTVTLDTSTPATRIALLRARRAGGKPVVVHTSASRVRGAYPIPLGKVPISITIG
ncbi:MAG TPA: hypothetical protein VGS41_07035, partial [Chthonomonadales bacterium]|nr:hypothetical protein [Chthonomonadales bacterium]